MQVSYISLQEQNMEKKMKNETFLSFAIDSGKISNEE